MILILIGEDYSTLSSFIPQSKDIETVQLSHSLDANSPDLKYVHASGGIVLIDITKNTSKAKEIYNQARSRFSNFEIWAYYMHPSKIIDQNLRSMGYKRVFSVLDNPPESILEFATSTRNTYSVY